MDVKNQHYVWRFYLCAWAVNDQLLCLRDGKIFPSNPKGVAAEKYFYRTEELTQNDFDFIEELALKPMFPFIQSIHRNWLRAFNMPFRTLNQLKETGVPEEKINEFKNWMENNLYEKLLSEYEGGWTKFLEELQNGNLEFFNDKAARMEFLLFLMLQSFRTNRMKKAISEGVAKKLKTQGFNLDKVWNQVSHIFAVTAAFDTHRNKPKLCLLANESSVPFITGDQPVVNIAATDIPVGQPPDKMELYYPITPKLAVLLTENENNLTDRVSVNSDEVASYNDHVFRNSRNAIYAHNEEILKQFQSHSVESD